MATARMPVHSRNRVLDSFNTFQYELRLHGNGSSSTCELHELRTYYDNFFDVFKWLDLTMLVFFTVEM